MNNTKEKPKSLLHLLNEFVEQGNNNPVDITFNTSCIRGLVVIGKTAKWILAQSPLSSVYQLIGMEVESYTVKPGRVTVVLK